MEVRDELPDDPKVARFYPHESQPARAERRGVRSISAPAIIAPNDPPDCATEADVVS